MRVRKLAGQKFDRLTVISKAPTIISSAGKKQGAWICQCDCGKNKVAKTSELLNGSTRSCGCHINEFGLSIKPGMKFNRLTTISYSVGGKWLCQCDCGNQTTTDTSKLNSGMTKSCGCLRIEAIAKNHKLQKSTYAPHIATARRRWLAYKHNDKKNYGWDFDISFDNYYALVTKNCFYCGIAPYNKINMFINKPQASQNAIDNGWFCCNGLDRINNNLPHILNNCVSCCEICNRAKRDRTVLEFIAHIERLRIIDFTPYTIKNDLPENNYVRQSFRHDVFPIYKDGNMTPEQVYCITQLECFYCADMKVSKCNTPMRDKKSTQKAKDEGWFYYNGIDRVDNTLTHTLENCVACCKHCNLAKSYMTLAEFQQWIARIKAYEFWTKAEYFTLTEA